MNKVALVTGASRGIGRAVATKLAQDGFDVVVNYNGSEAAAQEVVEQCISHGVKAVAMQCNVSDFTAVANMVEQVMNEFGKIDVLVNNSGITRDNLLLRMSEDDFDQVIDVNLKGCFNTVKHISKIMMKQRSGNIINLSSVIGLIGNVGQTNYAASKGGVIALTKSISKELASRNIRANAIAPGFIQTSMTDELSDGIKESILKNIPLAEFGQVEDVANCVSFLASDASRYITGQVIHVDGGMVV